MCQLAFDGHWQRIARHLGEQLDMPILFCTWLMGLTFGIDREDLGLGRLSVSPERALSGAGVWVAFSATDLSTLGRRL